MHPEIPDKVYFKISEVAEIVGVEAHVLRFWEKEFSQVRPERVGGNRRLYRRRHVETFLQIKKLLYEDLYTIAGAKKRLRSGPGEERTGDRDELLLVVRRGLQDLKKILESK